MKLNPFVKAGIGLTFALLWSCPTLAAPPYLKVAIKATVRPRREVHIDTRWSNSTTLVNRPSRRTPRPRAREFWRRLLPYQDRKSTRLNSSHVF